MKNSKLENYRSRRDLQLSSFEFFYLKSLRCSKKINDILRLKSIFDFSHLQFDGVRAQTDGSGMEGIKKVRAVALKTAELFLKHTGYCDLF